MRLVRLGKFDRQGGAVDPAVSSGKGDDTESRPEESRGPSLVGGDMRGLMAQHRFVRLSEGGERNGIGRRAAGGEPDLGVDVQEFADQVTGPSADRVVAIAWIGPVVDPGQRLHHLRHGAGGVV